MSLSTHVLDVEAGRPVAGVPVRAERYDEATVAWSAAGIGVTGVDGRAAELVHRPEWTAGRWRLVFDVAAVHGPDAFWPRVTVELAVREAVHHHIPLLLARHGYSTYRGS
ncbi:MAG TPA: hydroxyisourate hydrolase [Mycobacteriales bacterium]|nr:hydroxyisourate hydrolase [Mycobacteriales bacterium]